MKKNFLLLSFMALNLFNAQAQNIPSYVPANGLVGWWPFNGNANDESGNGNNGSNNGATLTTDRNGVSNSAYNFNGVSNFINCGNSSVFGLLNGQTITISLWFNANNNCDGFLISKYSHLNPSNSNYFLGYTANQNNLTITGNGSNTLSYNPILPNIWNMICVVLDNSSSKIYLNGSLVNQGSMNLSNNVSSSDLFIGKVGNLNDLFNGKMDDIGIWNRALTECEIQNLYTSQLNIISQSILAGLDQSICAGDNVTLNGAGGNNYLWNNNVVDGQAFAPAQSNSYVVTAQDSLGCSGTDTVFVTVLENASSSITQTALDSYTLNGQTYTQSGTYTQTLTAANGCDSTITLNLTLNFTGIDELGTAAKKLVKITDLSGKIIPRRKNTLMLFIYEDGTVERVVEMEE